MARGPPTTKGEKLTLLGHLLQGHRAVCHCPSFHQSVVPGLAFRGNLQECPLGVTARVLLSSATLSELGKL